MTVRSRVMSSVLAGGLVTGALVLGAPAAAALPMETKTADCGDTVSASPGDTITTPLGSFGVSSGGLLGPTLCKVTVNVVKPVESAASGAASGVGSGVKSGTGAVDGAVKGATGAGTPGTSSGTRTTPTRAAPTTASSPTASPAASGSSVAPGSGTATLADAPLASAFVPMFAGLPASFLASASPEASAVSAGTYDAGLLLGGVPAFRVALPSLLGDPTTAVTSASQLQALPIDGLGGGLGFPAVLAVLLAAGIAALGVRRAVLGRRVVPGRAELSRLLRRSTDEGTATS